MNTNKMELSLNEMEMVNGGEVTGTGILGGFFGSIGGAAIGGLLGVLGGPAGLMILAGGAIGAVAIGAATN